MNKSQVQKVHRKDSLRGSKKDPLGFPTSLVIVQTIGLKKQLQKAAWTKMI